MENNIICRCHNVSYTDIYNAMNSLNEIRDIEDVFRQLQEITSCSKGCGRCQAEIKNLISDILNGYADPPHHHSHE